MTPLRPIDISRRVRAARAHAGLGQEELAEKVGVHRQTITRWEDLEDEKNFPDAGRQAAIASACDWPNAFDLDGAVLPLPAAVTEERLAGVEQKLALLNSAVENLLLAGAARRQAQDPARDRDLG